MNTAPYRIHRMIQDLMRDPAAAAAFAADKEPTFEAYGLTDDEKQKLRDGSRDALVELGVHPNLQMKFRRVSVPPGPPGPSPIATYLEKLGVR